MRKFSINHLILFLLIKALSPKCTENENFCLKCHPLTNLCLRCENDVFAPNDEGGCDGIKKCYLGKNYCVQCNEKEDLCEECDQGLFPDSNGGCAYTKNCKISYKGNCFLCEDDFIYIEDKYFSRCKSIDSDDLKNCEKININGICEKCEDDFYLNKGDKKCSKTENCYKSFMGKCNLCNKNYYLNKKLDKCLEKNNTDFKNCQITSDGKKCEKCDDNYFLSEDGNCLLTNFCKKSENEKCIECIDDYYLLKNGFCSLEENCEEIDAETGLCTSCKNDYYLDIKTRKCKSNKEDNNYKYCKKLLNKECLECEKNYYLSNNSLCSSTKYCTKVEKGKCISCEDDYYLTLDNICTVIKGCIHSGNSEGCNECEDGYYYSFPERLCKISKNDFLNCRYSTWDQCDSCKDNYYLLKPERICYNNNEEGIFYKCKMSDKNGEFCAECEKEYFLTTGEDKVCVKMRGCKISEDENTCLQCDKGFCYDKKKKTCFDNYNIESEKNIKYFGCEYTDEKGEKCEKCLDGYTYENEICVNKKNCKEEDDGVCVQCVEKSKSSGNNICLNKDLGCIEAYVNNCYKCDDLSNLYSCTECKEGYKSIAGYCI